MDASKPNDTSDQSITETTRTVLSGDEQAMNVIEDNIITETNQQVARPVTGEEALKWLVNGNKRYVKSLNNDEMQMQKRPELVLEQDPFAIVLGCSDARVPVEIVFDQGLGDLFVIRVAGNVVAPSQIGSIEFAVEKFDTCLVVVLGHSNCGAVTACVDALINPEQNYTPNLQSIVDRIRPSVYNLHELASAGGGKINKEELIDRSIQANVRMSVSQLKHGSRLLEDMYSSGKLLIVGAEYNLATGMVAFLET